MIARFRADPKLVRVGVRRDGKLWNAYVSSRQDPDTRYASWSATPGTAVTTALWSAHVNKVEGIDPEMVWAYEHPQKPETTWYHKLHEKLKKPKTGESPK